MNLRPLQLVGITGGAALASYLLDPQQGRGRRARIRDQSYRQVRETQRSAIRTGRDLKQRAYGIAATARSKFEGRPASDDVLTARVRSRMGSVVSHPSAIDVQMHAGRVTLSGPILEHESKILLATVAATPGVQQVEDRMERHRSPEGVPGLQGEARRPARFELLQAHWSPTARLLVGSAGTGLAAYGASKRDSGGVALTALGLTLLARAFANLPLKRLLGVGERHAIDIRKAINIDAPLSEVYDFFLNFQNFPRFMSNVRAVNDLGGGRSHWTVAGPASVPVEWEAELVEVIPHHRLRWRTLPGSLVDHTGRIQFRPGRRGTEVTVELSYTPPVGALGHLVASLFGANPRREMTADLGRLKSLLEVGKTSAGSKTAQRESVPSAVPGVSIPA